MNQPSADAARARPHLLHQVSRGIFWNTALLPLVSVSGILLSVLVRRSFGLESGYYDAALGIANSILFYTSLGLAGSLPKFIPELQLTAGRHAAMQLIARLGSIRRGGGGGCRARPQSVGRTARLDARPRIERTRLPALALCAADRSRRARLRVSRARFRLSASQRQRPLAYSRSARSRSGRCWSCCWDWG